LIEELHRSGSSYIFFSFQFCRRHIQTQIAYRQSATEDEFTKLLQ